MIHSHALPPLSALVAPKESADARWEEMETPPDYVSTIQCIDSLVKLECAQRYSKSIYRHQ